MSILTALGVNQTVFILFGLFCLSYIALTQLVFKPYFKAFNVRRERTVGNQELAERFIEESKGLQTEYENKAKQINNEFRAIYDQTRTEAMREYDSMVSTARDQASEILEAKRQDIDREVQKAKQDLVKQVPELQSAIVTKLLGKELVQ
jgi:F-type H+-transporting ATPase subunit b